MAASVKISRASAAVAVALAIGCTVTPIASASSRRFRLLAASAIAFSTDGARYAAWQVSRGSPVVVFDSRTGAAAEVVPPTGCELYDLRPSEGPTPAAAGRFLLNCRKGSALLDARTHVVTPLPEPAGPYNNGWFALGARYVEGTADDHACQLPKRDRANAWCIALYDLATGALSYRPSTQPADLDRPAAPLVCRRLRKKLVPALASGNSQGFVYSDGLLARPGGPGGEAPLDRVVLEGCHGRRKVLYDAGERHAFDQGEPENVDLSGGVLSWDTGHQGTEYQEEEGLGAAPGALEHGTLRTYRLSTHQLRRFALPRLPLHLDKERYFGVFGFSAHTRSLAFWIAARTLSVDEVASVETVSVYAAALS